MVTYLGEQRTRLVSGILAVLAVATAVLGIWTWKLFGSVAQAENKTPRCRADFQEMKKEQKIVEELRKRGARRDPIDSLQFHEKLNTILKQIRPGLTPTTVKEHKNPRQIGLLQELGHQIEMAKVNRDEFGKMIFYLEKNLPGLKAKDINIPKWDATDTNKLERATVLVVYYVPVKK